MLKVLLHVAPGLVALAAATAVVLRLGSRRHRIMLTAVLVCWIGSTIGQLVSRHITAPLIVGDLAFAIWILWFASRKAEWWVWAMLATVAGHLLLHAFAYSAPAWVPYSLLYDALSLAALGVLTIAAVLHARGPRGAAKPQD